MKNGCTPPPTEIQERTAKILKELGVVGTARRLGISKPTVNAIAAGTPVTRGTLALVREAFRQSTTRGII